MTKRTWCANLPAGNLCQSRRRSNAEVDPGDDDEQSREYETLDACQTYRRRRRQSLFVATTRHDQHRGTPTTRRDQHRGTPTTRRDQHRGTPTTRHDQHRGTPTTRHDQHRGTPTIHSCLPAISLSSKQITYELNNN